jgi:signal transduction histidine kinase/CheY-like chemotaxis protein
MLVAGSALLVAGVLGTFFLLRAEQRSDAWVIHTLQVQDRLGGLTSRIQDSLLGQRGFLVTADPNFLRPYEQARARLPQELADLRALIADNPAQVAATARLEQCVGEQLALMAARIRLVKGGRLDAARNWARTGAGMRVTDRCRAILAEMKAVESRLLETRVAAAERQARIITAWVLSWAAAVALAAILLTPNALRRASAAAQARDRLAEVNAQLVQEAESRRAAETQLRQLQKLESIGQLTGGIAHDFNNMLAIVIGSLDLARRRIGQDDARAAENVEAAMNGAQRAAQLTAQLLAFGRRQPLSPAAIDASRLVRRLSELLRRTIGPKIGFTVEPATGLWTIHVDVAQLESALVNLCLNARDAMPDGGRLTITTANVTLDAAYAAAHPEAAPGDHVRIDVRDTGQGMAPDIAERAFEPFFTTKASGKGTGLGLSQVYGFVMQSGGHVTIASAVGQGTIVSLYLPRHRGAAEPESWSASADARLPLARDHEIVFVVDDEAQVLRLAVDALHELGYIVMQAATGSQALELLQAQPRVDLLLTDLLMPEMSGGDLSRRVRELRPEVKLLFMSGNPSEEMTAGGVAESDADILLKPFTLAQLAAQVRRALDREVRALG